MYHPAFGDFAKDFKLEELSIEKNGKEAKGRDLTQLITQIKQKQIKALFIQPQYAKSRVQSLANELNLRFSPLIRSNLIGLALFLSMRVKSPFLLKKIIPNIRQSYKAV